jgi:hypothetical protein
MASWYAIPFVNFSYYFLSYWNSIQKVIFYAYILKYPIFSPSSFNVSGLIVRSLICLDLIFVQCDKFQSSTCEYSFSPAPFDKKPVFSAMYIFFGSCFYVCALLHLFIFTWDTLSSGMKRTWTWCMMYVLLNLVWKLFYWQIFSIYVHQRDWSKFSFLVCVLISKSILEIIPFLSILWDNLRCVCASSLTIWLNSVILCGLGIFFVGILLITVQSHCLMYTYLIFSNILLVQFW